jgi:hypothetical protein
LETNRTDAVVLSSQENEQQQLHKSDPTQKTITRMVMVDKRRSKTTIAKRNETIVAMDPVIATTHLTKTQKT